MSEKIVFLPLSDIIDDWLKSEGIVLDWSYEELVRHKDSLEIALEFDFDDLHGNYLDVKKFLDMYEG
jgi:hypothetical protein